MEKIFHKYRSSFEKFWNWTPAYVSGAARVVGLVAGFAIVGTIGTVRLLIRKRAPPRENRNESDGSNLGCRDDTRDGELLSGNEEADTATNLQSNRAENCQQIQVSVSNAILFVAVAVIVMVMQWLWQWEVTN
jgi:hypothetical protein